MMRICFEILCTHGSLQIVLVSNISIVINRVLTYPLADLNYSARTDFTSHSFASWTREGYRQNT